MSPERSLVSVVATPSHKREHSWPQTRISVWRARLMMAAGTCFCADKSAPGKRVNR